MSLSATCQAPHDVYGVQIPFVLTVTSQDNGEITDEVTVVVTPTAYRVLRIDGEWRRCRVHGPHSG